MSQPIGIVGFGRFGHALAGLCEAAELQVKAYDPRAAVSPDLAAPSLQELARQCRFVVVAVPLDQMRGTFEALRPHLTDRHLVLDVGSVKVKPAAALAEVFGAEVPWVATHPLFGPASLARGDRPLKVVVCPNPAHPQAAAEVEALFTQLGCTVFPLSPEAHDQEMALTHALAFFVAKGMLEVGVPAKAPLAPPSFQGMARSIEAVRVDAGHLFGALHRHNPFAPEARKRLLAALQAADRRLEEPAPESGPEAPLAIPDLGALSPELAETRDLIDEVDAELVQLLARRAELSRRAGKAKAQHGLQVSDPVRERKLLQARRDRALALGLDPDSIEEIFHAILRFSRSVQR